MKKIQILGSGCPRCKQLAEVADVAAAELGGEYEIVKITDPTTIAEFGVVITPALAVDGDVKVVGKVPPIDDVKSLIS